MPTSQQSRRKDSTPYAFTEQGVAMLSSILHSEKAVNMHITIMRAFVDIRKIVLQTIDVTKQLKEIQQHITGHDVQLSQIYDAIENLLDEKAAHRKRDDRDRMGFKH